MTLFSTLTRAALAVFSVLVVVGFASAQTPPAYLTQWGSLGAGDGQLNFPTGVAVDGAGHVFVADRLNHRIQKFDGTGAFLAKWGSSGSGPGQFTSPSDVDSLTFDGLAVRVRGKKGPLCSLEDADGDGWTDLVCHFEDEPENWTGGGTSGAVSGELVDGTPFSGSDSICVVP